MQPGAIFRNSSTTYFFSSLFFPRALRKEITTLYAYVRRADDYVDSVPAQPLALAAYRELTLDLLGGGSTSVTSHLSSEDEQIVKNFVDLAVSHQFDRGWIIAFLDAMESDLHWPADGEKYQTYADLQTYMYGSASVIGLMICRILGLPVSAYPSAQLLGESMQLINFIRDVREDLELGRQYIPTDILRAHGVDLRLTSSQNWTADQKKGFARMILDMIARYEQVQTRAESGYSYIPRRFLIAIKTAADMYRWTGRKIARDPLVVLQKKIKPSKYHVISQGIRNIF